jgi:glycosyltransferase involved in cell wall biosynthesis
MAASYSVDFVVPCYHEEAALPVTVPAILAYARGLIASSRVGADRFRIILVDDGSRDATWPAIVALAKAHDEVTGIKLSRNYGHQSAILAGLSQATADAVITMDADLQDDIAAVESMLLEFEAGHDLVLGVRDNRESDTAFKRATAAGFYRVLALMGVHTVPNHADYRLTSRRALKALLSHNEVNLFLRGIVSLLGFKTAIVRYTRKPREFGETKYTLRKMLRLALDGITSFTVSPLRLITALGAIVFAVSILGSLWVLGVVILRPSRAVPGWASTVLPIFFFGGLNLVSIGVLGEYVGKIYMEVKQRPRFIVEDSVNARIEAPTQ